MLQALIDRQPGRVGTVFAGKGGAPVSARTLKLTVDALMSAAGIKSAKAAADGTVEHFTSHTFRHSAASWAALGGADPFMLRDTFAWKTLAMTNKYVKRADSRARTGAELVATAINSLPQRLGHPLCRSLEKVDDFRRPFVVRG